MRHMSAIHVGSTSASRASYVHSASAKAFVWTTQRIRIVSRPIHYARKQFCEPPEITLIVMSETANARLPLMLGEP